MRLALRDAEVVREERLLEGGLRSIRDGRVVPDGYIYLLTENSDPSLVWLEPVKR